MTTWVVIVAVGVGSFAFRLGPLLLFQRIELTERADRTVRQAGTAAITALIVGSGRAAASGPAALPTVLALLVAVVLAARGATMVRLVGFGGAIYAGSLMAVHLLPR